MTIDIAGTIGAISREIATIEKNGQTARVLFASRSFDTSVEDLWDALTSAERIPRWFMPISGDLRLGGRYQLEGNAGGEVLECDPPHGFKVTWEMQEQVSWVNVEVGPSSDGGAVLRLEHIAYVPDEMWDRYGPGAVGVGWDSAMLGLDQHFATTASVDPSTAMAWLASDEGRSFLHASSDAWCAASIAAGTKPDQARAAAARTTAAYTGEEEGPMES